MHGFVALIRGGDARAAGAVWSRLTAGVSRASLPGEIKGAASRVDTIGRQGRRRPGGRARCTPAALGSPAFVSV